MGSIINASSIISALPADILKGINLIIFIAAAIVAVILIYLFFLIARHITDIVRNHRIKKVEDKVCDIEEKLNELNKKADMLLGKISNVENKKYKKDNGRVVLIK